MDEIPESIKKKGGIKNGQKKKKNARKKLLVKRDKKRRQNNEVVWKTGMLCWSLRENQGKDEQDFTREITSYGKNMTIDITFFFSSKFFGSDYYFAWIVNGRIVFSRTLSLDGAGVIQKSKHGLQWVKDFFSPFGVSVT